MACRNCATRRGRTLPGGMTNEEEELVGGVPVRLSDSTGLGTPVFVARVTRSELAALLAARLS